MAAVLCHCTPYLTQTRPWVAYHLPRGRNELSKEKNCLPPPAQKETDNYRAEKLLLYAAVQETFIEPS